MAPAGASRYVPSRCQTRTRRPRWLRRRSSVPSSRRGRRRVSIRQGAAGELKRYHCDVEQVSWFEEMKRRRVFRALIGYGIVSFALLQVVEPVMHGLNLPEWVLTATVVGLGLG